MQFSGCLLKYVIFLFNLLFVVCGALLVVWGVFTLKNVKDLKDFEGVISTSTIPILATLLGAAIFIVAFFGCCGAITENVCCAYTYAVFMLIITCLQIGLVVWMFVYRQKFLDDIDIVVNTAFNKNDAYNGYPMDPIQLTFKCCGLNGYQDYGKNVPQTCCGISRESSEICKIEVFSKRNGCRSVFREFWRNNTNIVRWVGIFIAMIEFVVLWLACTLATKIRAAVKIKFVH